MTIRITNTSRSACSLKGWPTLVFVSPSGSVLATNVSHNGGPGVGFQRPTRVTLGPGTTPSAGFVVLSRDFPAENFTCQNVSVIRVSLPSVAGVFDETGFRQIMEYHLCDPGHPVIISAIVKSSALSGFAPPNLP